MPPYFLLSIAINEYAEPMRKLAGCVNDAEDFKSCLDEILGQTSGEAVCSLKDSFATRSAIITAFHEHLIHNPNIRPGDPIIIYYAGHGNRVQAPAEWQAPGHMVETLCPVDQGVVDLQYCNGIVPGIPDVTINALLSMLAREKGTNITFVCDSCHSGGVDRDLGNGQNFIRRGSTAELLDNDLDNEILRRSCEKGLKFGFHGNYSSHILLAACAAEENALEGPDRSGTTRGVFTRALTHELRELKSFNQISFTTYSALISSLKLYTQNPRCAGGPVNCFLFSGQDKFGPCVFPMTSAADGAFTVSAGHVHGVVEGTEMTVYGERSALREHGVLVVQRADSFSSKLRRRNGEYFEVPMDAWAGIRRWANAAALSIFTDLTLVLQANNSESEYPLIVSKSDTDFSLRRVRSHPARIEMQSPLEPHSKSFLDPGDTRLCSVLSKIAHFHYHLNRRGGPTNFLAGEQPVLHMYRLPMKAGSNLFKNNVAHLEMADATDSAAEYGIEIRNQSSLDLYAYLFAFQLSDYSIEPLHLPPVGQNLSPPLEKHRSIAIGYNGGGSPLIFDTSDLAPIWLKLIVCTENVSMHHMRQSSPLSTSPEPTGDIDSRYPALDIFGRASLRRRSTQMIWETSSFAINFATVAT
ncbi:caspase domain-containing protein [Mycena capillaripes]|nr:caspase domain-containing protein [Mycena capillaripes]